MSRKEKSRIDTSGGSSLGANSFALGDALGGLDKLPLAAQPQNAAPSASGSASDSTSSGVGKATTASSASSGANGSRVGKVTTAAGGGVRYSGRLDVRWEKSGRGGKAVTLLYGEALAKVAPAQLDDLLKSLKNRFGCGGTRDGQTLELQGRLVEQVMPILSQMGFRVVRSGS